MRSIKLSYLLYLFTYLVALALKMLVSNPSREGEWPKAWQNRQV